MKEYTILGIISVIAVFLADRAARTGIFRKQEFYIFLAVITFFKFLVNGFLTGREIIIYNPEFYLGFRIGTIPAEDFLFGFSMVALTIIFWEYFQGKKS